jgi:hypothetical protein
VTVTNVKATLAKAVNLCAEVLREVTEIQGMGTLAMIKDPQGGMLAFWLAAKERVDPDRRTPSPRQQDPRFAWPPD